MLNTLELKDFRSYAELDVRFSSPWAVFYGENGAGKSNLLEAVFYLAMLRSFRTSRSRELIRHGSSSLRVGGELGRDGWREELFTTLAASGARTLSRNGSPLRKSSSFIDLMLPVAFVPEDVMLVSGSALRRRRFVDMYLSMLDGAYRQRLYAYNSALMQRNNALKRGGGSEGAVRAFEPVLAENAVYIMRRRELFAAALAGEVSAMLDGRDGEFRITYRPDAPVSEEGAYREMFSGVRRKELLRGCTLAGPQLDEFVFTLNGSPMRSYASSGQRRKVSVYLKLAAYALLRKRGGDSDRAMLVVLVDDVTGELDAANRELFFECIKSADQVFFTFTESPRGAVFRDAEVYEVGGGRVSPARNGVGG